VPLPEVCVCYLVRSTPTGDEVLLGRKKAGLGAGRLVGPGGKLEPGESPVDAMVREIAEETSLRVRPSALTLVGDLTYPFPHRPAWTQRSWVFLCREWSGEPQESDELDPGWYPVEAVPVERMWHDAGFWVTDALAGRFVQATFEFGADLETVVASDHPAFPA
jgi:8-oxo-dGTP diphosphatase